MSDEREGFLARWSRRKADLQREETRPPERLQQPQDAEKLSEPVEAALTPEEIEALPKIEDLTAETDITAFLRKGVPEALRKAALRRAWALDPAIRDFRSEALDYAYDWNVPGGVPGNGPLLPTDDVAAMVRQVFGDSPTEAGEAGTAEPGRVAVSQAREPAQRRDPAEEAGTSGEAHGAEEDGAIEPVPEELEALAEHAVRLGDPTPESAEAMVASAPEASSANALSPPRKRHGGAKPL